MPPDQQSNSRGRARFRCCRAADASHLQYVRKSLQAEPASASDVVGAGEPRRARGAALGRKSGEKVMGLGRGILLWLLGVPLPIVILLALFWHH